MIKFSIALDLKTGLVFPFFSAFLLKFRCASKQPTHKIFQNKKKKKRKPFVQVEGFKKASFFDKILPDISSELWT